MNKNMRKIVKVHKIEGNIYFTSDEDVKECDWCIITTENANRFIKKFSKDLEYIFCSKIVATTDKTPLILLDVPFGNVNHHTNTFNSTIIQKQGKHYTYLPQMPHSFIEAYAKNPVEEVELEYEEDFDKHEELMTKEVEAWVYLKLTQNNEVIVHLIEEKLYSRSEMKAFGIKLMYAYQSATFGRSSWSFDVEDWIDKNLK
jgi:hypothetical protein